MEYPHKVSLPRAVWNTFRCEAVERTLHDRLTLFSCPPGYLMPEGLARVLVQRREVVMWLRIGSEDFDPATLLISLIHSAEKLKDGIGKSTLLEMVRHPGIIHGWPRLYHGFAREIGAQFQNMTVVFENVHRLANQPTLRLLIKNFIEYLPSTCTSILISHQPLQYPPIPDYGVICRQARLKVNFDTFLQIAREADIGMELDSLQKAVKLADGKSVVLSGILDTIQALGSGLVRETIKRTKSEEDLLAQIARAWIITTTGGGLQSVGLSMALGYSHPNLVRAVLGKPALVRGPWLEFLENDCSLVRDTWRRGLSLAVHARPETQAELLRRSADYLSMNGARNEAIPIYLSTRDFQQAARYISLELDQLMNRGQWLTLENWLRVIPDDVLHDWPWLIYAQGEIRAAQSDIPAAKKSFSLASDIFSLRNDLEGASQSLIAQSTLALRQNDFHKARSFALRAHSNALNSGSGWHQAWANWNLGCLASNMKRMDKALIYFRAAAEKINDHLPVDVVQGAERLVTKNKDLLDRRTALEDEVRQIEISIQGASETLENYFNSPFAQLPDMLLKYGWLHLPLNLKMIPMSETDLEALGSEGEGWLRSLLRRLSIWRNLDGSTQAPTLEPSALHFPIAMPPVSLQALENNPDPHEPAVDKPPRFEKPRPHHARSQSRPHMDQDQDFFVYCLGPLKVFEGNRLIETWSSRKAQLIFAYLLLNRKSPVSTDVLMDVFWPESNPEAARRNLHQAIYIMRQTLNVAENERHYILFENDGYIINPDLSFWIDHQEFERLYQLGQQYDRFDQLDRAIDQYRLAEGMYQDHLLADIPYEDWLQPRRQYLWQVYLSLSLRLGEFSIQQRDFTRVINLCQRILSRDRCQEEAYRMLMKSHLAQGHRQLAILQYQLCAECLREELDISPSEETRQLYQQLLDL